jgi:hypothetical protein
MALCPSPLAGTPLPDRVEPAAGTDALAREIEELTLNLGPDHPDTLALRDRLAEGLSSMKDYSAALEMYRGIMVAFTAACMAEIGPAADPDGPVPGSWAAARLAGRQAALEGMGEGVALLHAVSARKMLWLVLVAPGSVKAWQTAMGREELAELASGFRGLVASPSLDPREAGARLYDALVRPAEGDLDGVRTLMLSLDGELRYVPAAALWDGERWLAERWPTSLFTESTAARLGDAPRGGGASVRAMGVTAAWPGLTALPGVAAELAAVLPLNLNIRNWRVFNSYTV